MSEKKGPDNECEKFFVFPDNECDTQTNWEDINDTGALKASEWRFLVLNLGAPGAGKSSSIEEIKKYTRTILPSSKRRNLWTTLNHDTFVANDLRYGEAIEEYESINKRLRKEKKAARDSILHQYNIIRKGTEDESTSNKFISDLWNGIVNFDPSTRKGIEYINSFGTRILLYKSLIESVIAGKDIIYEAKGSKWETILNIFNLIKRHNCKAKSLRYLVIVSYNDTTSTHTMQNIGVRWQQSLEHYRSIRSKSRVTTPDNFELPKPWNLGDKKQNLEDIQNIKNKIQELSTCYNEETGRGDGIGIGPDILVLFDKTKKSKDPFIIPLSVRGTILYYRVRLRTTSMYRASLKMGKSAISSIHSKAMGRTKRKKTKYQTRKKHTTQEKNTPNKGKTRNNK